MATMFFRQEPGYGCPRRTPDEKGGTRRRGPKHRIGWEGRRDMTWLSLVLLCRGGALAQSTLRPQNECQNAVGCLLVNYALGF